jgi:hypothetical protein
MSSVATDSWRTAPYPVDHSKNGNILHSFSCYTRVNVIHDTDILLHVYCDVYKVCDDHWKARENLTRSSGRCQTWRTLTSQGEQPELPLDCGKWITGHCGGIGPFRNERRGHLQWSNSWNYSSINQSRVTFAPTDRESRMLMIILDRLAPYQGTAWDERP